jgi:hypothetical protein
VSWSLQEVIDVYDTDETDIGPARTEVYSKLTNAECVPNMFGVLSPDKSTSKKVALIYSFFRKPQGHFLPSLSGRSPVNCLSECGFCAF